MRSAEEAGLAEATAASNGLGSTTDFVASPCEAGGSGNAPGIGSGTGTGDGLGTGDGRGTSRADSKESGTSASSNCELDVVTV